MKLSTLLVAGSLAVNVALVAVYVSRTHSGSRGSDARSTDASFSGSTSKTPTSAQSRSAAAKGSKPISANAPASDTWEKLNTGDLRTLATRLRAAGFPESIVRNVIAMQINESFKVRRAQLMSATQDQPFWATDPTGMSMLAGSPKERTALRELNREYTQMIKDVLGEMAVSPEQHEAQQRRYGNLSQEKIDQLLRLDQDYNELRSDLSQAARGITLPEDRQKMAILEQEKRSDLEKILTPQEIDDYLMRTSTTTTRLRNAATAMNASESEFRAMYQAQAAFDEKYNSTLRPSVSTADMARERQSDQTQVGEQIKAALGEARYAEYVRASDRDFQQLNRLAQQGSLTEAVAVEIYNKREMALAESNRIFDDASLSPDQKRSAIQALGQNLRAEFTTTLGADLGARYVQVASRWLTRLDSGAAVRLTENGGMSSRTVPPARPPVGAAGAAPATPAR